MFALFARQAHPRCQVEQKAKESRVAHPRCDSARQAAGPRNRNEKKLLEATRLALATRIPAAFASSLWEESLLKELLPTRCIPATLPDLRPCLETLLRKRAGKVHPRYLCQPLWTSTSEGKC